MGSATRADAEFHELLNTRNWRAAGAWLVEHHSSEVIGLCRALVSDQAAAEDLAQEVFGRAFTALRTFRGDASPRTWLLTIARNRCYDHLRALGRDPALAPQEPAEPDAQPASGPLPPDLIARRDEVLAALAVLGEVERALVVLRFRHGLDYSELARIFGQRAGTLRMRLSRALARMRALLLEQAEPRARFVVQRVASPEDQLGDLDEELPPRAPQYSAQRPAARRPTLRETVPAGRAPAPRRAPPRPQTSPPRALGKPLPPPQTLGAPARSPMPSAPAQRRLAQPGLRALSQVLESLDPGIPVHLRQRLLDATAAL